jgi:hypothetical protein
MKDRFKLEKQFKNLPELFENKKRKVIIEKLCSDEEDKEAINKMFYHYSPKESKMVKSDPQVVYSGRHYIVIRSEMGHRRSQDLYHGAWVIGIDPSQDSGFFIHRLPHDERFENVTFNWTKNIVKEFMGFDEHYQGQEIKPDVRYRVQGDIMFNKCNEGMRNKHSGRLDNIVKQSLRKVKSDKCDFQEMSPSQIISFIEENELMDKENIPRQLNFQMANHLFMVQGVLSYRHMLFKNQSKFYVTGEQAKMVVIHDEHYNQTVNLEPGLYKVRFMRRHQEN